MKQRSYLLWLERLISITIIVLLTYVTIWVYRHPNQLKQLYLQYFDRNPTVKMLVEKVDQVVPQEIKKQVYLPPPLRAEKESPDAFLTVAGVINATNIQREKNGLPPLKENPQLDQSATVKANDMFTKQYFAHDSPDGIGVDQLANNSGYQYLTIGENLALGNFLDDTTLVQAWMDSPGHRENILKANYQEIGVAVVKENYQGESTWIAVQHFGRRLSSCPGVDDNLRQTIDNNKIRLEQMKTDLETKYNQLQSNPPANDEEFNRQAQEYNQAVADYNKLVEETKSLIDQYNSQVASFNNCAAIP